MKALMILGLIICTPSTTCVDEYFHRDTKFKEMEAILDYAYSKAIQNRVKIQIRYEDSTGSIIEYSTQ